MADCRDGDIRSRSTSGGRPRTEAARVTSSRSSHASAIAQRIASSSSRLRPGAFSASESASTASAPRPRWSAAAAVAIDGWNGWADTARV